jgi:DNA (cytosine-5)-methyltransferase 1
MKAIDLFAGCGGMSLGFIKAGFQITQAYDNWDIAIECYRLNFNHGIKKIDLNDISYVTNDIKKYPFDIIIGGPPCQDFSHAGKRKEGRRADLTEIFAQIVSNLLPKWFVMENVDRIAKSQAYNKAKNILINTGYGITDLVLNASYCGVPQIRKRFFAIGKLGENHNFLYNDFISKLSSARQLTIKDYFGTKLNIEYYYRHPRNYNRRAIFSVNEPSPTIRGVNRPIPSGYIGHPNDPIPINASIRPLTTEERAMIQTFPESFIFVGSKTDKEQIIGNAVPVNLAKFVADTIMKYQEKLCYQKQKMMEAIL